MLIDPLSAFREKPVVILILPEVPSFDPAEGDPILIIPLEDLSDRPDVMFTSPKDNM